MWDSRSGSRRYCARFRPLDQPKRPALKARAIEGYVESVTTRLLDPMPSGRSFTLGAMTASPWQSWPPASQQHFSATGRGRLIMRSQMKTFIAPEFGLLVAAVPSSGHLSKWGSTKSSKNAKPKCPQDRRAVRMARDAWIKEKMECRTKELPVALSNLL